MTGAIEPEFMKKLIGILILVALFSTPAFAKKNVHGKHAKKDNSSAAHHTKTSHQNSKHKNPSTKENVNPHTGNDVTVEPHNK